MEQVTLPVEFTELAVLTPAGTRDDRLWQKPSLSWTSVIDGGKPECLEDEKAFKLLSHMITTAFVCDP